MASTTYVNVDFEKLRFILKDRAGNMNKAERTLGCGHALSNARRNGKLAKPVVYAIEQEYGIKYEEYASDEIHIEPLKKQYELSEEWWLKLEEVIISAIKKALNE